jgi:hypothetical protein
MINGLSGENQFILIISIITNKSYEKKITIAINKVLEFYKKYKKKHHYINILGKEFANIIFLEKNLLLCMTYMNHHRSSRFYKLFLYINIKNKFLKNKKYIILIHFRI